ncbi:oxidoreductase ydgJ [Klebsiella grimontii]|uniref:Oxidoreductase ydgJ n=1 Tax=Klebsiella grimontii TaxID=2058152 RepID=A0A7H4P2Q5_9ENTR|nr:oxidoreductase ydgJ [Klebsiella grimontii]
MVVDKPFTVTLAQARELEAIAKSEGRLLSVFHNRRWDSDFLTVKSLINEGLLGEVVYFESHFDRYRPQVRQRWREQGGPGSGIWYDLAPHLLDQVVNLFGLPVSMQVDLAQLRPGSQSTDYFHAVLTWPQRRVVLHGTLVAAAETARFIIHGSRGSYVKYGLDPQEETAEKRRAPAAGGLGIRYARRAADAGRRRGNNRSVVADATGQLSGLLCRHSRCA